MADEGLKIRIGADLGDAIAQVTKLTSALVGLKSGLSGASTSGLTAISDNAKNIAPAVTSAATAIALIPAALRPVNPASMVALSDAVKRLKADVAGVSGIKTLPAIVSTIPPAATGAATALIKVGTAARGVNQPLIDLGRIVQDAPFGFIGIQNNISPLFESFRRLKAETGSTGGAFKALAGSLGGVGGVGLAISLLTSAATFASIGFDRWTGATNKTKAALDKTKEAIEGIVQDQAKKVAQVSTLGAALQSKTLTRGKERDAILELQRIAPDYFKNLDAEKLKISALTKDYQDYNKALISTIAAQIKTGELTEATKTRLDVQKQFKDATAYVNAQIAAGKTLDDINKSLASEKVTEVIEGQLRATDNQVKTNGRLSKTIQDQNAEANKTTVDRVTGIQDVVTALIKEQNILKSIAPPILRLIKQVERLQILLRMLLKISKHTKKK